MDIFLMFFMYFICGLINGALVQKMGKSLIWGIIGTLLFGVFSTIYYVVCYLLMAAPNLNKEDKE